MIEDMLARFMDGQTTEAEEQQLAAFFRSAKNIPDKWKSYQELFLSFETDDYAFSEEELDDMSASHYAIEEMASHKHPWKQRLGIAASVAILFGIGLVAYQHIANPSKQSPTQIHITTPSIAKNVVTTSKKVAVEDISNDISAQETKTSNSRSPKARKRQISLKQADIEPNSITSYPAEESLTRQDEPHINHIGNSCELDETDMILAQFASIRTDMNKTMEDDAPDIAYTEENTTKASIESNSSCSSPYATDIALTNFTMMPPQ